MEGVIIMAGKSLRAQARVSEQMFNLLTAPAPPGAKERTEVLLRQLYAAAGRPEPVVLHAEDPVQAIRWWGLATSVLKKPRAIKAFVVGKVPKTQSWHIKVTDRSPGSQMIEAMGSVNHAIWLASQADARAMTPADALDAISDLAARLGLDPHQLPKMQSVGAIDVKIRDSGKSVFMARPGQVLGIFEKMRENLDHVFWQLMRDTWGMYLLADFVIVIPKPEELHVQAQPRVQGEWYRLHNDAGPAYRWASGFSGYRIEGHYIPPEAFTEGITLKLLAGQRNSETRRILIEKAGGWDWLVPQLKEVNRAPDPGNPGQEVILYDLPGMMSERGSWQGRVWGRRLIVMTNASPDADGTRRLYAEYTDINNTTALEAQAASFGIPVDEYVTMQRAT